MSITATVTLITGDQVQVTSQAGKITYSLTAGEPDATFDRFRDPNGDEYLIPAEASPYLGHGLDRSLFDISALFRNGTTGQANTPVSLSFPRGTAPVAPPGVTMTSTGSSAAGGYVTPASGDRFAAALRRQIGADIAAGRSAGTTALPASLSLAGSAGPSRAVPQYVLHPVQINGLDLTGAPVSDALVYLTNTDSTRRESAFLDVVDGVARIEAPSGNYSAIASFKDFDADGNTLASRMVLLSDFTVPDNATSTTVTADERSADRPVSVSTPRPSTLTYGAYTLSRGDNTTNQGGISSVFGVSPVGSGPSVSQYLNTTAAPKTGRMNYALQWTAMAPKADDGYFYNVEFGGDQGLPAAEEFVVRPDQLAAVTESLYTDPKASAGGVFLAGLSAVGIDGKTGGSAPAFPVPITFGQVVTQYLGTADGGVWSQFGETAAGLFLQGDFRTYLAGRHYAEDWAKGPLAPGMNQLGNGGDLSDLDFCNVCSAGGALVVGLNDVGDSESDHQGRYSGVHRPTRHFTLYRNDAKVVDMDDIDGAELANLPAAPATYRAVFDQDLAGLAGISQSTASHTELTVKADPASDPVLSANKATPLCVGETASTPCRVLPAITVRYDLTGTDLTGTTKSPVQVLNLDVAHVSYNGVGSLSPITSATVSVSFDGGKTWRPVPIAGFGGHYSAAWLNPRGVAPVTPSIRVTAADTHGDTISQTIENAYTIGGAK